MVYKFVVFIAFVASTLAAEQQEANSFVSYQDNNNYYPVQYIKSNPMIVKVAATTAPIYAARATPIYTTSVAKVALPAVANYVPGSAYFTASASSAPSLVNYVAPSATTYFNAPSSASSVYAAVPAVKVASVAYAAPVSNLVASPTYLDHQQEYEHPKYEYSYSVEDHHTGDLHSQQEKRDGDHVAGQYSLQEADGTVRIVKYFDNGHGFNAIVEKQGTPTEAPVFLKKILVPVTASHY